MPRGFASAREAFAEIEARKNSGGGGGLFLKLAKDESAQVRFATPEPVWAWVHSLPKDGTSYRTEVCLAQDSETGSRTDEACPGCDREAASAEKVGWKDREYRRHMAGAINLIWRNGPVYEEVEGRKNFDKVVGHGDQVVKWTFGKVVLEELDGKAATYKDLTSRDFIVTRRGEKLDTVYNIEPLLDDQGDPVRVPLSDADKALIEEAPSLDNMYKKASYDDWGKKGARSQGSSPPAAADVGPFKKRPTETAETAA